MSCKVSATSAGGREALLVTKIDRAPRDCCGGQGVRDMVDDGAAEVHRAVQVEQQGVVPIGQGGAGSGRPGGAAVTGRSRCPGRPRRTHFRRPRWVGTSAPVGPGCENSEDGSVGGLDQSSGASSSEATASRYGLGGAALRARTPLPPAVGARPLRRWRNRVRVGVARRLVGRRSGIVCASPCRRSVASSLCSIRSTSPSVSSGSPAPASAAIRSAASVSSSVSES